MNCQHGLEAIYCATCRAASAPMGWTCPKCERVYGPQIPSCEFCNAAANLRALNLMVNPPMTHFVRTE